MPRTLIAIGATLGMLAVILGAFGAHALADRFDERTLATWQTGAHYHLIHAVAIVMCGLAAAHGIRSARLAGYLMTGGVLIFAGSLYALCLTGIRVLGAITPIGGLLMIIGWAVLAIGAFRALRAEP